MQAQNLVPVFSGNLPESQTEIMLCDARKLHSALGVGRRFTTWIAERISEYGFVENQDFVAISQKREIGHGRGRIDYHLTLDMGKELAMVERTDAGREVRRYFIHCEKIALEKLSGSLPPPEAQSLTAEQRGYLYQSVMDMCRDKPPFHYRALFSALKKEFQVASYKDIKAADYPTACRFLGIAVKSFEGEVIDPVPSPLGRRCPAGTDEGLTLAAEELADITRLAYYYEQMSLFYDHILPVFRCLESSYAGRVHNYSHEYCSSLCAVQKIICRLAKKMPDNECRQRIGQMMIRMN